MDRKDDITIPFKSQHIMLTVPSIILLRDTTLLLDLFCFKIIIKRVDIDRKKVPSNTI